MRPSVLLSGTSGLHLSKDLKTPWDNRSVGREKLKIIET